MFDTVRNALASWFLPKAVPPALTGGQWSGTSYVDAFKRNREPTANELLAELKNTAFTCATINAAACAAFPPRLYVTTHPDQPEPKCLTRPVDRRTEMRFRAHPALLTPHSVIREVIDHPLLTLLRKVNPVHNSFDLWELTTLYQEVHGCAYWYLNLG